MTEVRNKSIATESQEMGKKINFTVLKKLLYNRAFFFFISYKYVYKNVDKRKKKRNGEGCVEKRRGIKKNPGDLLENNLHFFKLLNDNKVYNIFSLPQNHLENRLKHK